MSRSSLNGGEAKSSSRNPLSQAQAFTCWLHSLIVPMIKRFFTEAGIPSGSTLCARKENPNNIFFYKLSDETGTRFSEASPNTDGRQSVRNKSKSVQKTSRVLQPRSGCRAFWTSLLRSTPFSKVPKFTFTAKRDLRFKFTSGKFRDRSWKVKNPNTDGTNADRNILLFCKIIYNGVHAFHPQETAPHV